MAIKNKERYRIFLIVLSLLMIFGLTLGCDNNGNNPAESGTPNIAVDPNPVQFGDVIVGTSQQRIVTVRNVGTGSLVIYSIANAVGSIFYIDNDVCTGMTVPQNGTCYITVRFTPIAVTTYCSIRDYFLITSNDPDENTVRVNFCGRGI